jgi:hypothetical protein
MTLQIPTNSDGKPKGLKTSDNVVGVNAYRKAVACIKARALDGNAEDQRVLAALYWQQKRVDSEGVGVREAEESLRG